ncbi:hypothetical protein PV325_001222 [Microctonus aethiopoides]|nr:hypothetical protein PV325_001222 [Microctonus aethiopoides]
MCLESSEGIVMLKIVLILEAAQGCADLDFMVCMMNKRTLMGCSKLAAQAISSMVEIGLRSILTRIEAGVPEAKW